jgi:uncharacterized delta-60 repeat protein
LLVCAVSTMAVACAAILGIDDRQPYDGDASVPADGGGGAEASSLEDADAGPSAEATVAIAPYLLVRQNNRATFAVSVTPRHATPDGITIEFTGLPENVTANETQDLPDGGDGGADGGDAGDGRERHLLFEAKSSALQGSYELHVRAMSGGILLGEKLTTLLVAGAAGSPDLSFGAGDGNVFTSVRGPDDEAVGIAVQADGKIVVGVSSLRNDAGAIDGDFALVRYGQDGQLDGTFGNGGILVTELATTTTETRATSLVQQADGKLVLAGTVEHNFTAARYLPDGRLDDTFGTAGLTKVPYTYGITSGQASVQTGASIPQTNGTILIVGATYDPNNSLDRAMVRLFPSGKINVAFGNGGFVQSGISTKSDQMVAVVQQTDGHVVTGGFTTPSAGGDIMAFVARWDNDGNYDSPGGDGIVNPAGYDLVRALAIQPDQKVIAAGEATGDFLIYRLMPNMAFDTAFAAGNIYLRHRIGSAAGAHAVQVDSSGGIVVAGWAQNTNHDVGVLRLTSGGILDTSFGTQGKVSTAVGGNDEARTIAFQPDGRILVAGYTEQTPGIKQILLLRYWQ